MVRRGEVLNTGMKEEEGIEKRDGTRNRGRTRTRLTRWRGVKGTCAKGLAEG